jgi:hypothetical protein
MRHVRPYVIFNLLQSPPANRVANVKIPNRRDIKLLETYLLVTAIRVVNAKRIFEFGTFFGSTTLNLALNSPPDAEILTLDLGREDAKGLEQDAADAPLTQMHFDRTTMDYEGMPVCTKIKELTGNSKVFNFSQFRDSIDLVFIDGGHDYETVKSDTQNSFRMLRKDRPACMFWHDYQNPDCSGNTYFLEELSKSHELFHVEDTMLCGWFNQFVTPLES